MTDLLHWEQDKALYLFTSLTAGSSHVISATSRIETILKSARIPFSYIDTATNESAKKLYQRRGKNKKLPLLVKEGFVIADLEQVEDWNEFGELKEAIGPVATTATSHTTTPAIAPARSAGPADASYTASSTASTGLEASLATSSIGPGAAISDALRKAAFESAFAAKEKKATPARLSSPTHPTPPPPVSTPVTAALTSPIKVPPPSSPLPEGTASNISEVISPTPGDSISSPPSRVTSTGSSHSSQFVPGHFDPPAMTHRGSSISQISQEEIKEIECREAIQEEDEEDYDQDAIAPKTGSADTKTEKVNTEAKAKAENVNPEAQAQAQAQAPAEAGLPASKEEKPASQGDETKGKVA